MHSVIHKQNKDQHLNNGKITDVDDIEMDAYVETGESVEIYRNIFLSNYIEFHKQKQ